MTSVVLGYDLSYSGLGMCALPLDFADGGQPHWNRAKFRTAPAHEMSTRARDYLALEARTFAIYAQTTIGPIRAVFFEDVPRTGFTVIQLAKLAAIVEREFYREMGIEVQFANISSARKLLYGVGRMPDGLSETQKSAWLTEPLLLSGARLRDDNQADAFTAANWGLHELGAPCLTGLLHQGEAAE